MDLAPPILLANVMLLGLRHGLDWDHLAAILDIVGTVRQGDGAVTLTTQKQAVFFAFLYALGHAFVCIVLGIGALSFRAVLPDWIDPIMERVVGLTLVFLGLTILWSIISRKEDDSFHLRSRWMLALEVATNAVTKLRSLCGSHETPKSPGRSYGPTTAFGIGMIHGIGAETASQVLMIVAVSQVATVSAQMSILLVFVFGLLLSNTMISLCAAGGYLASRQLVHIVFGTVTGVFSVVLGCLFLAGISL